MLNPDDDDADEVPVCECGHVRDEHSDLGSQECAIEGCECVAFDEGE